MYMRYIIKTYNLSAKNVMHFNLSLSLLMDPSLIFHIVYLLHKYSCR